MASRHKTINYDTNVKRKRYLIRLLAAVVTVIAVVGLLVGVSLIGNSFRFSQTAVTIPGPDGDLAGVLTVPTGVEPRGVVVMVHGDGAVEASQGGLYAPWFEGAADAGFATLSWSKPGVGESEGNWLSQSMDDRAAEVSAAIEWAIGAVDVPTDAIVLWGASQAGWVVPKVVRARDDIDAVVAVGPAINWLRQGRFNLLSELEREGVSAEERRVAVEESDKTRELLERGAAYSVYRTTTADPEAMSEDRWDFVLRNHGADATADLAASASQKLPVLLMVGNADRNVDVAETERVYGSIFGSSLIVRHVDGAHSLARSIVEDNEVIGTITAVLWPRALLGAGVIDDYTSFLSAVAR